MNSEFECRAAVYCGQDPFRTRNTMGKRTKPFERGSLAPIDTKNLADCLRAVLAELPAVSGAFDARLRERFGALARDLDEGRVL